MFTLLARSFDVQSFWSLVVCRRAFNVWFRCMLVLSPLGNPSSQSFVRGGNIIPTCLVKGSPFE
jgi:hypothetical protein